MQSSQHKSTVVCTSKLNCESSLFGHISLLMQHSTGIHAQDLDIPFDFVRLMIGQSSKLWYAAKHGPVYMN